MHMREMAMLLVAVICSYVLALALGWERKVRSHATVWLRVFPLVSVSSCVYLVLAQQLFTGADVNEQAHVLQGLMTGIGFIGAGAIIKEGGVVHGVVTAAAIWTTGAIGASLAYGYYVIALVLWLISILILGFMPHLRRVARDSVSSGEGTGEETER